MIDVHLDARQMAKLNRALGHLKKGVPRALSPAINRALDSGRTTVKREIRKEYLIKAKDIPVKISRASMARLKGEVRIQQGMLPLSTFKVRPFGTLTHKRRRPIFAQVKVKGGGKLPGAFFIPGAGPFIRPGPPRLPIGKLMTIGAPIMASQPSVGPAVNKAMGDTLAKRIDHEIKRAMANAGGH